MNLTIYEHLVHCLHCSFLLFVYCDLLIDEPCEHLVHCLHCCFLCIVTSDRWQKQHRRGSLPYWSPSHHTWNLSKKKNQVSTNIVTNIFPTPNIDHCEYMLTQNHHCTRRRIFQIFYTSVSPNFNEAYFSTYRNHSSIDHHRTRHGICQIFYTSSVSFDYIYPGWNFLSKMALSTVSLG